MFQRFLFINKRLAPEFVLTVGLIIVTKTLSMFLNKYLGDMLDFVTNSKMQLFYRGILILVVVQAGKMVFQYYMTYKTNMISEKCIRNMRLYTYENLTKASLRWLNHNNMGDLITRVNGDLDTFTNAISSFMTWQLAGWITFIISVISCSFINLKVTLISYSVVPFIVVIQCVTAIPISKYEAIRTESMGKANAVFIDMINGMAVTKAFNAFRFVTNKHNEYLKTAEEAGVRSFYKEFIMFPLQLILSIGPQLLCVGVGAYFVIKGELSLGNMLSIILISSYGISSVTDMAWQIRSINSAIGVAKRINEIWEVDTEKSGDKKTGEVQDTILEMSQVSFSYGDRQVLHNISLSLKKGEKVALVGTSGSGKSTILKLITGFYPHDSGSIRILGNEIEDWDVYSLRKRIAYLDQNTFLFSGSILSNVMLGNEEASPEEACKYIAEVGFTHNINDGIGENGVLLSGGEKQRVCIARAMMKNADLILLDEPTSSLDGVTEHAVMEALDKAMQGRTCLIIAHRFSTIQNVDCIICMQDGNIVESGTHEQLMKNEGLYRSLYEKQFMGGEDNDKDSCKKTEI